MSDHIPEEVMSNILLRLSVKDLVSCRLVTKQWLSIIDDPHFISRQLQRSISTNSNSVLFLQDKDSPTLYWKQNCASHISFFSNVLLMGSCHGLVCFSLSDYPHDFLLLNPSTGEHHTVSCPMNEERVGGKLKAYGFGYDESSDDYKVVRVMKTKIDRYRRSYHAEICGIRSKDFSSVISLPTAVWKSSVRKSTGVFVSGAVHWCIRHSKNTYLKRLILCPTPSCMVSYPFEPYEHVIHAIDLVSNTYRKLQWPNYNFGHIGFDDFNVGIIDTHLCFSGFLKDVTKIGIWVMEEYGNPKSWNMRYCIEYACDQPLPQCVTYVGRDGDNRILLMIGWYGFVRFVRFDPTDDTTLTYEPDFRCGGFKTVYCLESLVRIFPNSAAAAADHVKEDVYDEHLKKLTMEEITQIRQPAERDLEGLVAVLKQNFDEMRNEN